MAIEDDPVLSEAARPVSSDTQALPEVDGNDRPSGLRNVVEWVAIAGGALLVAFLIKTFLLQAFYIPSLSMAPTLKVNDRVLVNKLSYDLHEINRGDIVVFESPPNEGSQTKDLIKRVIALPGETVEAHDGHIYIDGSELEEPYLGPDVTTQPFEKTTIPPDHYWVMGDNRPNSRDSRFYGAISESLVIGRAFVRVWPVTNLSML
ncbi:MAG TPA: signal peptidase I [Acidimicrobiales bacterium]|nr:signal peptidase I [Acidimicrobiales bacterium]